MGKDGDHYYHLSDYGQNGHRETKYFNGKLDMYHRTFSEIINTLVDKGFKVVKMVEPIPSKEQLKRFPDRVKEVHKPSFLLMKLLK